MILNAKTMTDKEMKELDKKKLIDVNDFEKFLRTLESAGAGDYSTDGIISMLEKQQTVDAVEVVRCKECNYGMKSHLQPPYEKRTHLCRRFDEYRRPDFFCADGERRSDDC